MIVQIKYQSVAESLGRRDGAGARVLYALGSARAPQEAEDHGHEGAQHRLNQGGVPGDEEAVAVRQAGDPLTDGGVWEHLDLFFESPDSCFIRGNQSGVVYLGFETRTKDREGTGSLGHLLIQGDLDLVNEYGPPETQGSQK